LFAGRIRIVTVHDGRGVDSRAITTPGPFTVLIGVSDPGARLVRAALDAGVPVTVLPGPSAVETALVASGLVGERYAFLGFLPRREAERAALWAELASWLGTLDDIRLLYQNDVRFLDQF
jgi:16S rRNA C1402 (ribose-2'-O) methylase RsmI